MNEAVHTFFRLLILTCLLAGASIVQAQPPQQLRVVETIWGFDGRVTQGQFNPLSVLLDNLTDQTIEGQVTLRSVSGMVRDAGGLLMEPVYLAPNTRRWVQFYPYVSNYSASWRLTLRTPEKIVLAASLDQPRSVSGMGTDSSDSGRVAAVILDRTGMASREPTTVKHMPAEIFPPYATATVGLSVLFLDHVPDWETPRQQALLSWVRCGGRLHLLRDANGQPLQFSGILSPLNEPFQTFSVGGGRVQRHDVQRGQLVESMVRPLVRPVDAPAELDAAEQPSVETQWQADYSMNDPGSMDSGLLSQMRELTQPEHAWWLIFLLSLMYISMIFPGCWILSQKRSLHYLTTYGAIAGLAVSFSLLFLLIGRRGYGESTVQNSLTIARAEDAAHWNLFQWQTLFVVSGDRYLLGNEDQQSLLASGNREESIDAIIQCGNRCVFDTRIPPFSSQSVVSRRRVEMPDWKVAVREVELGGSGLVRLELDIGPDFPRSEDCQYLLLFGRRLYSAFPSADGQRLQSGSALQTLTDYCNTRQDMGFRFRGGLFFGAAAPRDDQRTASDRFYQESINSLVKRSLLDDGVTQPKYWALPPDRVRLMVYSPTPESLHLGVNADCQKFGRTLFIRDLPLQAAP